MRRHLASTRCFIGLRTNGLQQHVFGRDAESKAEGTIAIVRKEPVVTGAQHHAGSGLNGFVASARDLEENLLLTFQKDFTIVNTP